MSSSQNKNQSPILLCCYYCQSIAHADFKWELKTIVPDHINLINHELLINVQVGICSQRHFKSTCEIQPAPPWHPHPLPPSFIHLNCLFADASITPTLYLFCLSSLWSSLPNFSLSLPPDTKKEKLVGCIFYLHHNKPCSF